MSKESKHKLTPKQALFVREYLVDKNATQAAIRAGYSKKTAGVIGDENLKKPYIKKIIKELLDKALNSIEITIERTLLERARLAFFDVGELALADVKQPSDIARLPMNLRQAISGWKWDKDGRFVVMLADKNAHLVALERHQGLYEKDNEQLKGENLNVQVVFGRQD